MQGLIQYGKYVYDKNLQQGIVIELQKHIPQGTAIQGNLIGFYQTLFREAISSNDFKLAKTLMSRVPKGAFDDERFSSFVILSLLSHVK